MPHRWILLSIAVLALAPVARADRAFPMPGIDRIAAADAIVVGRVIGMEPQDVEVPASPGSKIKIKYRIAVVNVSEVVLGKKGTKTLRVGFVPVNEPKPNRRRYPSLAFKVDLGQNGLMFLRKHPTENIYMGRMNFDFVPYADGKSPPMPVAYMGVGSYADELKQARRIARMLADPLPALKSKDPADRFTAAAHLIARYRIMPAPGAKTTPVSAEETRLIMTTLLDHDWKSSTRPINGWPCFHMLGLTDKDGWRMPAKIRDFNDLRDAARAWFRERGKDYRIQRFILSGE
ncbi:MAG: hypothetical protein HYX68_00310 [Planctomycetes bacterium]|nr:hypothetical protein [Planctomycetota bacterium]